MKVLRDFILFSKNPSIEGPIEIKSTSFFLKLVWNSFYIILIINTINFLLILTPLKYFNLYPSQKDITFSLLFILKISLVLPIIEELIFRLPLKISKINLATPLCIILFLFLHKLSIYLAIFLPIVSFVILFFWLKQDSNLFCEVNFLHTKYFSYIFYIQALIFGFLHLTNFRLDFKYIYLFPFFIINHILVGCFFGYLRVRYNDGIILCISAHVVVNSINCLLLYHWN
jgi:hypothetical protein